MLTFFTKIKCRAPFVNYSSACFEVYLKKITIYYKDGAITVCCLFYCKDDQIDILK